jgi:uncharacterized membrane protein
MEWFETVSSYSTFVIDMMALFFVAIGTVQAFVGGLEAMTRGDGKLRRRVWLRYGYWLVSALAFQLAADIIETAVSPSWEDLGRLAAIAVIRTFLDYFLVHDLEDVRAGGGESARA